MVDADIRDVLNERGTRYGNFETQAKIAQKLKDILRSSFLANGTTPLRPFQIEALEMICHKIARLLNGDPNFDDTWRDIAGYAALVASELDADSCAMSNPDCLKHQAFVFNRLVAAAFTPDLALDGNWTEEGSAALLFLFRELAFIAGDNAYSDLPWERIAEIGAWRARVLKGLEEVE